MHISLELSCDFTQLVSISLFSFLYETHYTYTKTADLINKTASFKKLFEGNYSETRLAVASFWYPYVDFPIARRIRAIFNWVSKLIPNCFGFALLCSVIGLKKLAQPTNQSNARPKPLATWSHALRGAGYVYFILLRVLIGSLRCLPACVVIG